MRINNNLMAMNTHRQMGITAGSQTKSMEKLSSGYRINRAGDDAAGLAISEKMRAQIKGLDQASRNSQDAISLVQTAEGALNETQSILQRMRELSVQSANDTNVDADRTAIQNEISQLTTEIDRIGNTTEFNTRKLLNGGAGIQSTTDNADVNVAGGSADVVGGNTLELSGFTSATKATSANVTMLATSGGSFNVNGTTLTFADAGADTDNATAVADLVNANSDSLGVTAVATGANVVFSSTAVGSAAEVSVTAGAGVLSTADPAVAVSGADATITIDAATTGTDPTSYTAKGNNVVINDGDYAGLELKIAAGSTTATATLDILSNGSLSMQIGANEGQDLAISLGDMRATALGVGSVDISTAATAKTAITTINDAITSVSSERAKLGAVQNRLEHTIANLDTSAENLQASESRIRDVDMAKEMMEFTKNNILQQAAQSMLSQANQAPQGVLQLLR